MQAVRESVLLVDDEPQVLAALEDLLGDDFEIFKTESPLHALDMVRDVSEIAVVISDQRMPMMGGDELLTKLSASSDARGILVTAFADIEAVVRAVNGGRIFAYVTKPWNPQDLRQKVREAANHYRLAQESLRKRRLQETIMDHLNEGIIVVDQAGKCLHFNLQAERLLGAGPRDVDPASWAQQYGVFAANRTELLAPNDNPLIRAMRGEHGTETEAFIRNAAVRGTPLSISGTPLPGGNQLAAAAIAVLRDITEQRELEAQHEQSQKMDAIGRLASGVAHDFNNLLAIIQSYAALVRDELPTDDSKRDDLAEVLTASERAAMLTQQLLTFGRKEVIQRGAICLNEVVTRLEKLLRRSLGEEIELLLKLDPALGMIWADGGQVEQILLNLLLNARDAMPSGGQLTIATANVRRASGNAGGHEHVPAGDLVLLTVTDVGIGMDAETQGHIFEPFFTTKEFGKGAGLGLATVYGIVQQSAGHVHVRSQLGHGTEFEIYFPEASEANDHVAAPPSTGAMPPTSGTILVVDDEDAVRQVAVRILRSRGHTVLEAVGPSEARARCAEHGPSIDLLLTDVVMPECTGLQLAQELTRMHSGMRVVYMSGFPGPAAGEHTFEPGSHYIDKPFSPATLIEKIEALLHAAVRAS